MSEREPVPVRDPSRYRRFAAEPRAILSATGSRTPAITPTDVLIDDRSAALAVDRSDKDRDGPAQK